MVDDAALSKAAAAAEAALPRVSLPDGVFLEHLRSRLEAEGLADPKALQVDDLFLACACLHGDAEGWRELEKRHLSRIPEFVARFDTQPSFADEVRQRLCEKLLHATDGGAAKLASYTGRGPLGGWLRISAIREAQSAKRRGRREVDPDDAGLVSPAHSPEIQLLKQRYAVEFKEAFAAVLVTLSADERNVLRLHYLDGLTLEEVGKTYRVSRATAARWIASAKEKIVEQVQARLGNQIGQGGPAAPSLLALVKSQFDMSLRRHFT